MDIKTYAMQIFTFFGYGERFSDVFAEQRTDWHDLIDHAGFKDEGLADKYRHAFYAKTVNSPFAVYSEFTKFIIQNPRIREEHYETQYRTWGECPYCHGAGHLGPIPVYRQDMSRRFVFLDRVQDDRVRQQLARRANALFFELREFGHAKLNGSVSKDAYDALKAAGESGTFKRTFEDLRPELGDGKRVYRKCACEASIKYAGLELVSDYETAFLDDLSKQKRWEVGALFSFHGVHVTVKETAATLNSKLQASRIGLVTDAIWCDGYHGDYDARGETYNQLRLNKRTQSHDVENTNSIKKKLEFCDLTVDNRVQGVIM